MLYLVIFIAAFAVIHTVRAEAEKTREASRLARMTPQERAEEAAFERECQRLHPIWAAQDAARAKAEAEAAEAARIAATYVPPTRPPFHWLFK